MHRRVMQLLHEKVTLYSVLCQCLMLINLLTFILYFKIPF